MAKSCTSECTDHCGVQGWQNDPEHKARKVPTSQDVQERKETMMARMPSPPRLYAAACSSLCITSRLGSQALFIVYGWMAHF